MMELNMRLFNEVDTKAEIIIYDNTAFEEYL